jgi:hypothetical protein
LVNYIPETILGNLLTSSSAVKEVGKHNRSLKVAVQGPDFWPTPSTYIHKEVSARIHPLQAVQFNANIWRKEITKIIHNHFAHCGVKHSDSEIAE